MKMDDVTQQNTALVEEAAAAAESMMEQADELMNAVSVFQLEGQTSSKHSASQVERRVIPNAMRSNANHTAPRIAPTKPAAQKPARTVTVKSGTDDNDWEEF